MKILFLSTSGERGRAIVDSCAAELQRQGIEWSISDDRSDIVSGLDLVYLLSYDRILASHERSRVDGRVVLFHSSDLPFGRGWAPIYHAMANRLQRHTITLCYAADSVDSGNVLAKARLPIGPNYVASMLRRAGQLAISTMIARYTSRFAGEKPNGAVQASGGSYNPRRSADDARVDASVAFKHLVPHLLASEPPNLAFFDYRGERFRIQICPENTALCRNFTIEEYFSGHDKPDAVVSLQLPE